MDNVLPKAGYRQWTEVLGNPEARMQLVITHPTDLPETRNGGDPYPFVIDRYERYFPVEPRVRTLKADKGTT